MKKFIFLLSFLCVINSAHANNVVISNISLVGSTGNFRMQFDLSWENGWRVSTGQNNYDGVWVFFKFRTGGGEWQHLTMTGTGNVVPANYTAYQNTGVTKTGAIIHRTNNFAGTSTLTDIELGVSDPAGFGIDIRGYAIEMVFIPQCSNCIIGDGNGTNESDAALHVADNTSGAFGAIFHTDVNGLDDAVLETGGAGISINATGITGNANFPTGQAFWCMKYEISQGAIRDFINILTLTQQTIRTESSPSSSVGIGAFQSIATRNNFIEIATSSTGGAPAVYGLDASGNNVFNESSDGEWVACSFLNWPDIAAYLDWAGLAPMTEIGFERICRGASTAGANASVFGEFAWGTTSLFATPYTLTGTFGPTELTLNSSPTLGNANYGNTSTGVNGPLRNGIFATASSNRVTSGASFYGVMEMTGNVKEMVVTIGNVAGRAFTGINGDGSLSSNGNANVLNWPCSTLQTSAPACSEVISSAGIRIKGGSYQVIAADMRISDRGPTSGQPNPSRNEGHGGRGVFYIN